MKEQSNEPGKSAQANPSCWDKAYALIELDPLQLLSDVTKYQRIEHYWRKTEICSDNKPF